MKKNIEKISNDAISQLADIGQLIRQHRRSFKITANAAAQTAGISRVTLHRIEKGEPTVSMGAYLNVVSALDLNLHLSAKGSKGYEVNGDDVGKLPVRLSFSDYPQLKSLHGMCRGLMSYLLLRPTQSMNVTSASWISKTLVTVSRSLSSYLALPLRERCLDVYPSTSPTNSKST